MGDGPLSQRQATKKETESAMGMRDALFYCGLNFSASEQYFDRRSGNLKGELAEKAKGFDRDLFMLSAHLLGREGAWIALYNAGFDQEKFLKSNRTVNWAWEIQKKLLNSYGSDDLLGKALTLPGAEPASGKNLFIDLQKAIGDLVDAKKTPVEQHISEINRYTRLVLASIIWRMEANPGNEGLKVEGALERLRNGKYEDRRPLEVIGMMKVAVNDAIRLGPEIARKYEEDKKKFEALSGSVVKAGNQEVVRVPAPKKKAEPERVVEEEPIRVVVPDLATGINALREVLGHPVLLPEEKKVAGDLALQVADLAEQDGADLECVNDLRENGRRLLDGERFDKKTLLEAIDGVMPVEKKEPEEPSGTWRPINARYRDEGKPAQESKPATESREPPFRYEPSKFVFPSRSPRQIIADMAREEAHKSALREQQERERKEKEKARAVPEQTAAPKEVVEEEPKEKKPHVGLLRKLGRGAGRIVGVGKKKNATAQAEPAAAQRVEEQAPETEVPRQPEPAPVQRAAPAQATSNETLDLSSSVEGARYLLQNQFQITEADKAAAISLVEGVLRENSAPEQSDEAKINLLKAALLMVKAGVMNDSNFTGMSPETKYSALETIAGNEATLDWGPQEFGVFFDQLRKSL